MVHSKDHWIKHPQIVNNMLKNKESTCVTFPSFRHHCCYSAASEGQRNFPEGPQVWLYSGRCVCVCVCVSKYVCQTIEEPVVWSAKVLISSQSHLFLGLSAFSNFRKDWVEAISSIGIQVILGFNYFSCWCTQFESAWWIVCVVVRACATACLLSAANDLQRKNILRTFCKSWIRDTTWTSMSWRQC